MNIAITGVGYPLLGAVVLLGALGIPLPLTVALAAAGALARQGHASLPALLALCTAAAVGGDSLGYAVGRFGIAAACVRAHGRLCSSLNRWLASPRVRAATERGARFGLGMGMLVFLTRWALTAPSALVNVLAGARRYRWENFLLADFLGEALWAAIALAQGYLLGGIGGWGLTLAVVGGALIALATMLVVRWLQRRVGTREIGSRDLDR